MNEPFIPLADAGPSTPGRADFRVVIVNPAAEPQPFRSLHQCAAGSGSHSGEGKPTVTLQRDGERVSAIRIQCACGQLIELTCVYPLTQPKAVPPGVPAGQK